MTQLRFRDDNTEGYTATDLAALNAAFATIMGDSEWCTEDDAYKSWQDHVAETLLSRYDAGERGDSLLVGWTHNGST